MGSGAIEMKIVEVQVEVKAKWKIRELQLG
jgi:hypothetical protein